MGRGIGSWLLRILLAFGLAVAVGFLPYRLYGEDGVTRTLRLEEDLQQILRNNRKLLAENELLKQRITRLRQDRAAIEQVARDELGYVKSSDVVFLLEGMGPATSSRKTSGGGNAPTGHRE